MPLPIMCMNLSEIIQKGKKNSFLYLFFVPFASLSVHVC